MKRREPMVYPGISCSAACIALDSLRALLRRRGVDPEKAQYASGAHYVDIEYREWVRARLAKSDIALLLASGFGSLPDLGERRKDPFQELFVQKPAATVPSTVRHLAAWLEFYLEPQEQRSVSSVPVMAVVMSLGLVVHLLIWLGMDNPLANPVWPLSLSGVMLLGLARLSLPYFRGEPIGGAEPNGPKYLVNCVELYHYLKQCFNDDLPKRRTPEQIAELSPEELYRQRPAVRSR
jgi:hypothetical protein